MYVIHMNVCHKCLWMYVMHMCQIAVAKVGSFRSKITIIVETYIGLVLMCFCMYERIPYTYMWRLGLVVMLLCVYEVYSIHMCQICCWWGGATLQQENVQWWDAVQRLGLVCVCVSVFDFMNSNQHPCCIYVILCVWIHFIHKMSNVESWCGALIRYSCVFLYMNIYIFPRNV